MKTQIITSTVILLAFGITSTLASSGCSNSAAKTSCSTPAQKADIIDTAQNASQFKKDYPSMNKRAMICWNGTSTE